MDLLIDTHVLIWTFASSRKLTAVARAALANPDNRLFASAVIAWEFADLRQRRRLPVTARFDEVVSLLSLTVLDLPGGLWRDTQNLPNHHGDPVDRMLIAHARHLDITLVIADATIRSYPLRTLW